MAGTSSFTFDYTTNTLSLPNTNSSIVLGEEVVEPANVPNGQLRLYASDVADRTMLEWKTTGSADTYIQAALAHKNIGWWKPASGQVTLPATIGFQTPVAGGTATRALMAATNQFTRTNRLSYVSAATSGSICGIYQPSASYSLGSGSMGGFYLSTRFGGADANAKTKQFAGLFSTVTVPAGLEPSTFTNAIGVGAGTADSNLSLYYGGSAAQTPIALGANFPAKTNATDMYEVSLYSASDLTNSVGWKVLNLRTGIATGSTITAATAGTQLPLPSTMLGFRCYRWTTGSIAQIDIANIYVETDF